MALDFIRSHPSSGTQVKCDECRVWVTLEAGQIPPVLCPRCAAVSERTYFAEAERLGFDTRGWPRFHTS